MIIIKKNMDPPEEAIKQFIMLYQKTKKSGAGKAELKSARETKLAAKNVIIDWMVRTSNDYIHINDQYLILKKKKKMPALNGELIAKAYLDFHSNYISKFSSDHGPEEIAVKFSEFVSFCRTKMGTDVNDLSIAKRKPVSAVIFDSFQ
jgi:hypothetical protein